MTGRHCAVASCPRVVTAGAALVMLASLIVGPSEQPRSSQRLVVGFTSQTFVDVDKEEARSVTTTWANTILRRRVPEGEAEALIFEDADEMRSAFLAGTLDLAAMVVDEYVKMREEAPIDPVFVTEAEGAPFFPLTLIVRQDSGIRQIRDLEGKVLAMSSPQRSTLQITWLECLLMRQGIRRAEDLFASVRPTRRPAQAILGVFFKQADACLTTLRAFKLTAELNPQVGKELMVLEQSPDLAGGVIVFRRDYPADLREPVSVDLASLHDSPQGQQLLGLFRVRRLVPFGPRHVQAMEALAKEHHDLATRLAGGS